MIMYDKLFPACCILQLKVPPYFLMKSGAITGNDEKSSLLESSISDG